jgi:hypothetical protein
LSFQTGKAEGKKTLGRPTGRCEGIIGVDPERIYYDDVIRARISGDNSSRHVPYTGRSDVIFLITPGR